MFIFSYLWHIHKNNLFWNLSWCKFSHRVGNIKKNIFKTSYTSRLTIIQMPLNLQSPENDKCRTARSAEPTTPTNVEACKEQRLTSPSPIPVDNQSSNVVQVSIVTPSTPAHNEDTPNNCETRLTCSSTSVTQQETVTTPSTISENRQDNNTNVIVTYPPTAKSKSNVTAVKLKANSQQRESSTQLNAQCTSVKISQVEKKVTATDDGPKISRPDSTTSSTTAPKRITTAKLCLSTKPVITSNYIITNMK